MVEFRDLLGFAIAPVSKKLAVKLEPTARKAMQSLLSYSTPLVSKLNLNLISMHIKFLR